MKRYAHGWLTLAFFLGSLVLHWYFGWTAFVEDARQPGSNPELSSYLVEMSRDTFENWQSEFLQLLWQVVVLAYFLYLGSPASKENDDRIEAKIDALLRINAGKPGDELITKLDRHFMRTAGVEPHAHSPLVEEAGRGIKHVAA